MLRCPFRALNIHDFNLYAQENNSFVYNYVWAMHFWACSRSSCYFTLQALQVSLTSILMCILCHS